MIDIKGYEGLYKIDDNLDIYSVGDDNTLLVLDFAGKGYVQLTKDGQTRFLRHSELVIDNVDITDPAMLRKVLTKFL